MVKQITEKQEPASEVEVGIEKLVYGGDGLARLNGQVVLIPFVLPGEQVQITTARVKGGVARGNVLQILNEVPGRAVPGCEYFTTCGGCQYQHANYELQLTQKQAILRETLRRLGGIEYEEEISVVSGPQWNYRNRIQLHFRNKRTGFYRAGSHDLCEITHCPISSPVLNEVIGKLQAAARQPQWPDFLQSLEVFTNEDRVQLTIGDSMRPVAARFFDWCGTFIPQLAHEPIEYLAAGHTYRIGLGSFFQVNRFLVDALIKQVAGEAQGQSAVDLYAGVGLFTLPLADRFETVYAVERGGSAFRDLETNAKQKEGKIQAERGSAEEFLGKLQVAPDLLIADPPRTGLGNATTAEIIRLRVPRMTLVSCDPATLGRDLKTLVPTYKIERMTLIDLFPQTYHFETIVQLALN